MGSQVKLYLICQRYKFESESQQNIQKIAKARKLYLICQRYKFESESQLQDTVTTFWPAVFNMSKIQI